MALKYSKGRIVHRKKSAANTLAAICRRNNVPYRITKLKEGYRVDKKWG